MIFISICIGIILFLGVIHCSIQCSEKGKIFRKIPGPRLLPIIGNGLDFMQSQERLFYKMRASCNTFKKIFKILIFHQRIVFVYNPQDIEIILTSRKHITKNIVYRFLRPWLKNGLLTSTGTVWQHRRKMLTPAFHFNILKQFHITFLEQSNQLIEVLHNAEGREVEILPYIRKIALNTICETAMGTNLNANDATIMNYENALHFMGDMVIYRVTRFWYHINQLFYFSPNGKRYKKELEVLHSFTTKVIAERRCQNIVPDDTFSSEVSTEIQPKRKLAMLDLLLKAEADGLIDEKGIVEEVNSFMFGGHDTVTMAMVYCLFLLANNPQEQKMATDEVDFIMGNSSRNPTTEDLNSMQYLERCIKESMRIFPIGALIGREIEEDLQLTDYLIPAGTSCMLLIYDMHKDPKIYPNPEKFDPDRFLLENASKRHPFAYLPFSAGPRNCLGQKFAMLEMKAVISAILRNFKILPVTRQQDLVFILDFILRPKKPIIMKFIPRC